MLANYDVDTWEEVESSMIKGVGTKGMDLVVQFHDGAFYRYPDLAHEMDHLLSAPSVGKYFHQEIRNQRSQRLGPEWPDDE